MLLSPENMTFTDKKFCMIIYGSPGIGKTTLALSAPNPILIDFDHGIARVKANHRKMTIVCKDYNEVLNDVESSYVTNSETIVIDTGGSFVTFLQTWAMKTNPATNCQKDGKTISIKGHGTVKSEFIRFSDYVRNVLHKHVVFVFHSNEEKDAAGNIVQRILCEGAARNVVWQPCDFGGYMQMINNRRTIDFTPSQEYFAKGCFGITGKYTLPDLTDPEQPNDFLDKLFEKARANIAKDNEALAAIREKYDALMAQASALIEQIDSPEAATALADAIPKMDHALTSLTEIKAMFRDKCSALGYVWDKDAKSFKEREAEEGQA